MIYGLYSVKDIKISMMTPFSEHSDNTAIRLFTNSKKAETPNAVNTNPEDKELWKIGTFDDQTGKITEDLKFIMKASDIE